jgi:GNAT superfamily N-acetyltransferase
VIKLLHGYEIDDDPARLDLDAICGYLLTDAYWHRWRTKEDVAEQIRCSWRCVGLYAARAGQVGFARAISDGVALGYLADVYVLAPHRGRGLGHALVAELVDDPPGRRMRWLLHTADMHGLYAGLGFGSPPATVMEREAVRE